jgi:hypothetical protein
MSQRTKNGFAKPDTRVIRLADLLAFGGVQKDHRQGFKLLLPGSA